MTINFYIIVMKVLFYNKNLPLDKYFGTNLSITELSAIHDKYEFIVCTHPQFWGLKFPPFENIIIKKFDDLFGQLDNNDNILIIRSIMKKFNGYEVNYININKMKLIEIYPDILNDKYFANILRKEKIEKILKLEKLKNKWTEKNS